MSGFEPRFRRAERRRNGHGARGKVRLLIAAGVLATLALAAGAAVSPQREGGVRSGSAIGLDAPVSFPADI